MRGFEVLDVDEGSSVEQLVDELNAQDGTSGRARARTCAAATLSPTPPTPHPRPPRHAAVLVAEPDWEVQALREPNDKRYNLQWGLRAVRAPEAWNTTTGPAGDPVTVCIIDSGIDAAHVELSANLHALIGTNVLAGNGEPSGGRGGAGTCARARAAPSHPDAPCLPARPLPRQRDR